MPRKKKEPAPTSPNWKKEMCARIIYAIRALANPAEADLTMDRSYEIYEEYKNGTRNPRSKRI